MQAEECPLDQSDVSAYFHLQHCINGFGQLLKALMGVSLVRVPLAPGQSCSSTEQQDNYLHCKHITTSGTARYRHLHVVPLFILLSSPKCGMSGAVGLSR